MNKFIYYLTMVLFSLAGGGLLIMQAPTYAALCLAVVSAMFWLKEPPYGESLDERIEELETTLREHGIFL